MKRIEYEALKATYTDCIGTRIPTFIQREMLRMIDEGTPTDHIKYALQEAAKAPRPSWRYALAIINRLQREGVPAGYFLPY